MLRLSNPGTTLIPGYQYCIVQANSPEDGFQNFLNYYKNRFKTKRYTIQNDPKVPQIKIDALTALYLDEYRVLRKNYTGCVFLTDHLYLFYIKEEND